VSDKSKKGKEIMYEDIKQIIYKIDHLAEMLNPSDEQKIYDIIFDSGLDSVLYDTSFGQYRLFIRRWKADKRVGWVDTYNFATGTLGNNIPLLNELSDYAGINNFKKIVNIQIEENKK
jgi:hypothetical protein